MDDVKIKVRWEQEFYEPFCSREKYTLLSIFSNKKHIQISLEGEKRKSLHLKEWDRLLEAYHGDHLDIAI